MMRKGLALFSFYAGSTPGVGVQRDLIGTRVIPRSFVLGGVGGGTGGTGSTVGPVHRYHSRLVAIVPLWVSAYNLSLITSYKLIGAGGRPEFRPTPSPAVVPFSTL